MTATTWKIEGMDKMIADLKKMDRAAQSDTVLGALEAGGHVIVSYASDNARNKLNKHPTGFLTNSFAVKREGRSVLAGVFGVVYAKIHEFGGVIKARNKPFLAFQVDGGDWVFTKSVTIPARPYMRPACDEHQNEVKEAIIDALTGLVFGGIR
jgi:HK97 gp10 family phage protein